MTTDPQLPDYQVLLIKDTQHWLLTKMTDLLACTNPKGLKLAVLLRDIVRTVWEVLNPHLVAMENLSIMETKVPLQIVKDP